MLFCGAHYWWGICVRETGDIISCFKMIWVGKPLPSRTHMHGFISPRRWGFLFGFQRTALSLCIACKGSWKNLQYWGLCQQLMKSINFIKLSLVCLSKILTVCKWQRSLYWFILILCFTHQRYLYVSTLEPVPFCLGTHLREWTSHIILFCVSKYEEE